MWFTRDTIGAKWPVSLALTCLALLGACGEGETQSLQSIGEFGRCPEGIDVGNVNGPSLDDILRQESRWLKLSGLSEVSQPRQPDADMTVDATVEVVTSSERPERLAARMHQGTALDVEAALIAGAPFVLLREDPLDPGYLSTAIAEVSDSTVFLGPCADRLTEEYAEFLKAAAVEPSDGFRLVSEYLSEAAPDGVLARHLDTSDSESGVVFLVPGEAPDELLAGMVPIALRVSVPDAWAKSPGVICTRLGSYFGECASLNLSGNGAIISMNAYGYLDRNLEIVLLTEDADVSKPALSVGEFRLVAPEGFRSGNAIVAEVSINGPSGLSEVPLDWDEATRLDVELSVKLTSA